MLERFSNDLFLCIMEYINYREIWLVAVYNKPTNEKLRGHEGVWKSVFRRVFGVEWIVPLIMPEPFKTHEIEVKALMNVVTTVKAELSKKVSLIKVQTWRQAYDHWKNELTKSHLGNISDSYPISKIFAGVMRCRTTGYAREYEIMFIIFDEPLIQICRLCSLNMFGPCCQHVRLNLDRNRCGIVIGKCGHYYHSHCLDRWICDYLGLERDMHDSCISCEYHPKPWIIKFTEDRRFDE